MKKVTRRFLTLFLICVLAITLPIPAMANAGPCIEFRDGTTVEITVGKTATVYFRSIGDYDSQTSPANYLDYIAPAGSGTEGIWEYDTIKGLKKGTITFTYSAPGGYEDVVFTIKVVASKTKKTQPTSPFILTDEFSALLSDQTGEPDTAITTGKTKFGAKGEVQDVTLPSGLWAKTAVDDDGQLLYGDENSVSIKEDGYADDEKLAFVRLPEVTRTVTGNSVWGRATPNSTYQPLITLHKGDEVYYIADNGYWALVLTKDGRAAYMARKYLTGFEE